MVEAGKLGMCRYFECLGRSSGMNALTYEQAEVKGIPTTELSEGSRLQYGKAVFSFHDDCSLVALRVIVETRRMFAQIAASQFAFDE